MSGFCTRSIGCAHDDHGQKALFTMIGVPSVGPTLVRGHRFILAPM